MKLDLIKQRAASDPGTGPISLGTAFPGYIGVQNHPDVVDGALVEYSIRQGNDKEYGIGTYTLAGNILTRTYIQGKLESGVFTKDPGVGLTLTTACIIASSPLARNMNFRGCKLYHSTTQSIPNSTTTDLLFDSEYTDTDGFHDTITNNSRITIPANRGINKARIYGGLSMAGNSSGIRVLSIAKTGTEVAAITTNAAVAGSFRTTVSALEVSIADGDYFTLAVYQSSGVPLDANNLPAYHWFALEVIE